MVTLAEQTEHLSRLALFAGCTKKELGSIVRAGDVIMMTDGTRIVEQGQVGREAFVVLDGQVVVRRGGRKVADLGAGDVIGELALLDHGPRTETATCDGDCTLLVIDHRHFRAVLDDQPAIAYKLLVSLAGRARHLDRRHYG